MDNFNEEFQKLELDELEGVSGGLDLTSLNPEERKRLMSLRKKYLRETHKIGTDDYDAVAVKEAHKELLQYVNDMEQKYGK